MSEKEADRCHNLLTERLPAQRGLGYSADPGAAAAAVTSGAFANDEAIAPVTFFDRGMGTALQLGPEASECDTGTRIRGFVARGRPHSTCSTRNVG